MLEIAVTKIVPVLIALVQGALTNVVATGLCLVPRPGCIAHQRTTHRAVATV